MTREKITTLEQLQALPVDTVLITFYPADQWHPASIGVKRKVEHFGEEGWESTGDGEGPYSSHTIAEVHLTGPYSTAKYGPGEFEVLYRPDQED